MSSKNFQFLAKAILLILSTATLASRRAIPHACRER